MANPTTPEREQEIAARCDVLPPDETWIPDGPEMRLAEPHNPAWGVLMLYASEDGNEDTCALSHAEISFMAHARTDIPDLLHTIRELREQNAALEAENARLRGVLEGYADAAVWACERCQTTGVNHTRPHNYDMWLGGGDGPDTARAALAASPATPEVVR